MTTFEDFKKEFGIKGKMNLVKCSTGRYMGDVVHPETQVKVRVLTKVEFDSSQPIVVYEAELTDDQTGQITPARILANAEVMSI